MEMVGAMWTGLTPVMMCGTGEEAMLGLGLLVQLPDPLNAVDGDRKHPLRIQQVSQIMLIIIYTHQMKTERVISEKQHITLTQTR